MNEPVRIGVIGTGFGARVVAPVFSGTPGCDVVEVVTARDATAVRKLCARSDVDLIAVHSPPLLHVDHVTAAIAGGHAVLCDKPFGRHVADAEQMLDRAVEAGVPAFVNFEFRHQPARVHIAELIRDGTIGTVEHVSWVHVSSGSRVPLRPHGWLFDRSAGGGWLGAWGSHAIDCLRWWFGEIEEATGHLRHTVTIRPDAAGTPIPCDADDGFRADLTMVGGASISIDSTFAATASLAPRVVIVGSAATVEVVADRRVVVRSIGGPRAEWTAPEFDGDPHLVPMRVWAVAVRDAVRKGAPASGMPTFADGLAVRRALDAIAGPR